jgi:DNA topoisomerase-1
MKLVIVESPAKAKTIEKYLGKDYSVKASKGHVVDLPKSEMGIDFDHNYAPTYVVTKQASVTELKKAFKVADELIIAVDPDREGEAIGWHVARELGAIDDRGKAKKKYAGKVSRIVFTEITKDAIQNAVKNPREIDMDMVNAQEARRVLDRIVGYKLSPLLWKKIRFGLSAGRVQSVAVRLIVDREIEREKFVSDEYWSLDAYLNPKTKAKQIEVNHILRDKEEEVEVETTKDTNNIKFSLSKVAGKDPGLTKQKDLEKIIKHIQPADWKVTDVVTKSSKRSPKPPFTTSTLQQTAANWFGFSAKRTMQVAQKLYEQGFITYMRTDSTNLSQQAITEARKFIAKKYGKEYMPETGVFYKTKSKVAQEAHEAIRPTHFDKTATNLGLDNEDAKLYTLIWQRALASQMSSAEIASTRIDVLIDDYLFIANSQMVKFPGYLSVYPEKVADNEAPSIRVGEILHLHQLSAEQHFTQPPARYTEATLIKKLEAEGIGRPSTYAPIITTIQSRGYVEKQGAALIPTDTARVVNRLLVERFPDIVDLKFTSGMEDELDSIANGELAWTKMIDQFYKPFDKNLDIQSKELTRADYTVLAEAPKDIVCPECGSPMVLKLGRFGRFYSCSRFPDCKGMRSTDGKTEAEVSAEAQSEEFLNSYEGAPQTEDGRSFMLKRGRFGQFWAHPDYPKVKDARPLVMQRAKLIETYGEIPQTKDGKDYLLRKGRFGEFWAHPNYPEEKDIIRIKKQK